MSVERSPLVEAQSSSLAWLRDGRERALDGRFTFCRAAPPLPLEPPRLGPAPPVEPEELRAEPTRAGADLPSLLPAGPVWRQAGERACRAGFE